MLIKFHGIQNIQVDVLTIDACAGKDKIFTEVKIQTITYLISTACWVLASARMTEIFERCLISIRYIFLKLTPLHERVRGSSDRL